MTQDQALIVLILAGTVAMFLWGRWRHDMVAVASLLACVFTGLVPMTQAFSGFGHPAVITVACVLVLSRGLQTSGAIDAITRVALPSSAGPFFAIASLTALGGALSAFMNNVGALALLMPVAIQTARKQGLAPGQVLMPLSFGSILGGMTTLIGTPPNLIVSGFRAEAGLGSFGMFDFAPVGLAVAAAGIVFLVVFSRFFVPRRELSGVEDFDTGAYMTEARVGPDSKAAGKSLRELGKTLEEADAQVVGFVRDNLRVITPSPARVLRPGDILIIEAEPESLTAALSTLGLTLAEAVHEPPPEEASEEKESEAAPGDRHKKDKKEAKQENTKILDADEVALVEMVVRPDAPLIGRSATDILLRTRFAINLLALSRQGRRSIRRLRSENFRAGDVLLIQGAPGSTQAFAGEFGCVPLAERSIRIPDKRLALTAGAIMAAAVGGAALGLLPAAISFAAGVLAAMALRVVPPRMVYRAIDWPVIVLLAALIPVAGAMADTGAADLIARFLLETATGGSPILAIAVLLVLTMTLSDFMNNAATAAVMCPIAISAAAQLEVNPSSFLMAVAIGASCAFLTPIGHQNNTLILGPGGFRFGDYWRLGLPLEILVVAVSIPLLLIFWPL